jgi:hypothetical protein
MCRHGSLPSFTLQQLSVMLALIAYALAASPLLLQAGANPVPALEYRDARDQLGAVASESDICSKIGIDLLSAGGNAADAVSQARWHSTQTLTMSSSLEQPFALALSPCTIQALGEVAS